MGEAGKGGPSGPPFLSTSHFRFSQLFELRSRRRRFTDPRLSRAEDVLFKNYFDVIGMILFSIDVVMAPFGLAWEDVGARFSNVVSLISVGYWTLGMILSFVRPYERDGVPYQTVG